MQSLEELKDYIISDMIAEVKDMTREQLERALISAKAERIESFKDLTSIITYGKRKSKN